ncbi:hypothetical protein J5226_23630 [Lysobacter sp. K5869]|uniref:hypothetical protein n=1 Tax=Lysobacter sp. K5869 TaxID=2820808 RepID=UPI001C05EEE1|nr:hypothetical protein [Lysobacter sp. K5869]QWP76535.1 hypothetical protein J5226_23630 [Lysobacter sp. K5869]
MADASNGVSGSNSSQNASDAAERAAATSAAQQAADDKAAADALAAAAVDPTPVTPVDISISPAALSQLSAMTVDPAANPVAVSFLGGVPTYADVAQAQPALPTTPAITEYNVWSPSVGITPNDPAAVANATIDDVSINFGMNYTGSPNATLEARMGISPLSVTGFASVSFNTTLDSVTLSTTLGPFGPNSTPSYNAAVKSTTTLGNAYSFDFNAGATFNNQGFQNADVTGKLGRSFSENLSGYVQGGLAFDNRGLSRITGEGGLNFDQNGLSVGFTGRGSFDVRTGEPSGYLGVRAGGKF